MTLQEKAQHLCDLMAQNKSMQALEELYHEDVVVVEANGDTRNGKAAQRKAVQEWFGMV